MYLCSSMLSLSDNQHILADYHTQVFPEGFNWFKLTKYFFTLSINRDHWIIRIIWLKSHTNDRLWLVDSVKCITPMVHKKKRFYRDLSLILGIRYAGWANESITWCCCKGNMLCCFGLVAQIFQLMFMESSSSRSARLHNKEPWYDGVYDKLATTQQ
jgi:hypothetical protein